MVAQVPEENYRGPGSRRARGALSECAPRESNLESADSVWLSIGVHIPLTGGTVKWSDIHPRLCPSTGVQRIRGSPFGSPSRLRSDANLELGRRTILRNGAGRVVGGQNPVPEESVTPERLKLTGFEVDGVGRRVPGLELPAQTVVCFRGLQQRSDPWSTRGQLH
jgi:hypothetical protein